jgi:hypothetical protein
MRTTLDIDDAVLSAARAIARDEGISVGSAVSLLARRGLTAPCRPVDVSSGFPAFEVDRAAQPITIELVNEYRD